MLQCPRSKTVSWLFLCVQEMLYSKAENSFQCVSPSVALMWVWSEASTVPEMELMASHSHGASLQLPVEQLCLVKNSAVCQ